MATITEFPIIAEKFVDNLYPRDGEKTVLLRMKIQTELNGFTRHKKSMIQTPADKMKHTSRTCLVNVPEAATLDDVTSFYSDCRIGRHMASSPIIDEGYQWAIDNGYTTVDAIAAKQVVPELDEDGNVVFEDDGSVKPQLDEFNNLQYRMLYVFGKEDADIDDRVKCTIEAPAMQHQTQDAEEVFNQDF